MTLPPQAVLCPLYLRVERLPALAENLRTTTPTATLFLRVIPDLTPAFDVKPNMALVQSDTTGYGQGINLLARKAVELGFEWLFVGADDLDFKLGWYEEALRVADETKATVIGTNDLHNPRVLAGQHATHFLVHRDFMAQGSLDGPDTILSEAYHHSCVDDELFATAYHRNTLAVAMDSHVEHLHPLWGFGEMDETYAAGAGTDYEKDLALLDERMEKLREEAV